MLDQISGNTLVQIIGGLLSALGLAFVGQWGNHRIQALQARKEEAKSKIDTLEHREERDLKAETVLRAELMAMVKEQNAEITGLKQREDDCKKRLVWMQQWLWTLHAALNQAGIVVELPQELTLDGFPQPIIPRTAASPFVLGLSPIRPDIPTGDSNGNSAPETQPPPAGRSAH